MSDQPITPEVAGGDPRRPQSAAPAFTLLGVIVLWYAGVAALLLSHLV
jgi:hypothetical protein